MRCMLAREKVRWGVRVERRRKRARRRRPSRAAAGKLERERQART
jgi:hypothetical protein